MSRYDLAQPLGQDNFRGITRWIIIISGVILVFQQFYGSFLSQWLALNPVLVLKQFYLWQVVTYAFLHSGIFHWLFNMFIFWAFGAAMQRQWGTPYFVRFLLITTIGSALCILVTAPHSYQPAVGSSGAVFGLMIAFAMLYPEAVIHVYFLIPLKAWQAALVFCAIELFAIIAGGNGVLRAIGHLGGMGFGYLYIRFGSSIDGFFTRIRLLRHPRPAAPRLEEVTENLVEEVDRILSKVSKEGSDSLNAKEKSILERYTKRRR